MPEKCLTENGDGKRVKKSRECIVTRTITYCKSCGNTGFSGLLLTPCMLFSHPITILQISVLQQLDNFGDPSVARIINPEELFCPHHTFSLGAHPESIPERNWPPTLKSDGSPPSPPPTLLSFRVLIDVLTLYFVVRHFVAPYASFFSLFFSFLSPPPPPRKAYYNNRPIQYHQKR